MKLAISNIAWRVDEERAIAGLLQELGVMGVEVAPTRTWTVPSNATDAEVAAYRRFWESRGIQIVAIQSTLFGRPELTIFEDAERRKRTLAYLSGMIRLGARLGARVVVFGSPRNRRVGALSVKEIDDIAVPFFAELGRVAGAVNVRFCIEPNPIIYGCDFITTSTQGAELVRRVGSEGFGLHLDAAAMTASREPVEAAIANSLEVMKHFHVSEVHLSPIGAATVEHQRFADSLRKGEYKYWISIEMRASTSATNIEPVGAAVRRVTAVYGRR